MTAPAMPLPAHRTDLVIQPIGDDGRYVVKDPRTGDFFQLGEAERFLLTRLDGKRTSDDLRAAFAEQFGEPLSDDELGEFIHLVHGQGLLQAASAAESSAGSVSTVMGRSVPDRQSVLYWRKSLWDPDRFFTWLTPRIAFCWTPAFLIGSAGCILLAIVVAWANRHALADSFVHSLRWETAVVVWLTCLFIGVLHECAHGLTCKHFGGTVHETGFLLLYLMPCFYCNVSDAWLFRERSKRIWVTFAGGYFELFLWALAVFVWRLTPPGAGINTLAFVVLSVGGIQTLCNFVPFLKLDGYYLLSDWLEIPNLQQRALDRFRSRLRRLLWGAPMPDTEPNGRLLLSFGFATWLFSAAFLFVMLEWLGRSLGARWGFVGLGGVAVVGLVATRLLFRELSAGEVNRMVRFRHKRTVVWLLTIGALAAGLFLIEIEDRAGGAFQVRPVTRVEVRASVAGFLREVHCEEGDHVSPSAPVAGIEVPDLASRMAQKQAELREAQAKLHLLEAGTRPEELAEQRRRVERATAWRDLARNDLAQLRQVFEKEILRLDQQIVQFRAEMDAAQGAARRTRVLAGSAISVEQHQEADRKLRVCRALLEQALAEKQVRAAKGTLEAETELARRERELADVQTVLNLMLAGPRAEEVEAERAHLARLKEEANYLDQLDGKQSVMSPATGLVTTPHMKEKVGQFVREGDLICIVEGSHGLEVEIAVAEQDVGRVQPNQPVALRTRVAPFATIPATVARVAPAASRGDAENTVIVYGQFDSCDTGLRSGMTGYARISTGSRPIGVILADRAVRWFRNEFWWW